MQYITSQCRSGLPLQSALSLSWPFLYSLDTFRMYLVNLMGNISSLFSLGYRDSLSFENILKSARPV